MIHPIFIMATLASAVGLAAWGTLLWQIAPRDRRRPLIGALVLLGLLMSPAAFFGLRYPLLIWPLEPVLKQPAWDAGNWSIVRDAIRLSFAPVTEEPAKLAPWLVLLAAGCPLAPTRRMVAPLAMAAGLGFAVGEIWLVAGVIAHGPDPNQKLAGLPWYAFGGFFSERLMTCVTHSLFALPTVALSRRGWKWGAIGLVLGMSMHWIGNAPIALMRRQTFGWSSHTWALLIQLWLVLLTVVGLLALIAAAVGRHAVRKICSARMICPECGAAYRQPIFLGLNFGMSRYERCGVCRKWHWVTLENLAPIKPPPHQKG